MDQVVLSSIDLGAIVQMDSPLWTHPLLIPSYFALLSIVILVAHAIFSSGPIRRLRGEDTPAGANQVESGVATSATRTGFVSAFKGHVETSGGSTIFFFQVSRFVVVLALLCLAIFSFVQEEGQHISPLSAVSTLIKSWGKKHKGKHRSGGDSLTKHEWLNLTLCLTYLYAAFLALVTLTARRTRASVTSFHLSSLLLGTFAVYAYRNIWPLLTFTLSPVDAFEGGLLWIRIGLLAFTAVVIPLLIPRRYIPIDSKARLVQDPQQNINPEQTASILSMTLYTFLDPIIFLAYRVPHLSHDMLPPLADYDCTRNLHLDSFSGSPRRHILWGFMTIFRREYMQLAITIVIKVFSTLMAPFGMNQLLRYLETHGEGAVVRPWVWATCLFLGPALGTIAFQWYFFIAAGTLVRTTAIVTQLVFEHALRIRMKAETSSSPGPTPTATPDGRSEATTPDSGSVVEIHTASEDAGGDSPETRSEQSTTPATSIKGKQKEETPGSHNGKEDGDKPGASRNLVGKMNNLVSTDLENIVSGRDILLLLLYTPLQVSMCVWFLYNILGWSAFIGLAVMIALFPIPGIVAGKIQKVQKEAMRRTDARVQAATETMGILRMIKLFGWEPKIVTRIAEKREQELRYIKLRQILTLIILIIKWMVVTFITYTAIMKRALTPSTVFSSMAVFDILGGQLHQVFRIIPMFIEAWVSLNRVNDFLEDTELLDEFTNAKKGSGHIMLTNSSRLDDDVIGFQNANFTWSNDDADGMLTPSRRRFTLRVHGELLFKRGCFNLIIGPTGSGKTSLLMALLGEMHFVPTSPDSWYHLPRAGGVSYAAQESWVQNETIRDNILFGAPYDEERYNKVIYQCGLQRDLSLFDAGDKTEVGEKGLTLSGGQKARVTLARAVYSSAQIVILDDVLAALDVHTARWVVDKCFKGDLIRGRTVLLVTHNVAMAGPFADYVISLGQDGRIASRGSELAEGSRALRDDEKKIDGEEPGEDAKLADGKLILAEEIAEGHVSWDAVKLFINGLGGTHPVMFWILFVGGILLCNAFETVQKWFMGYWAERYNVYPPEKVNIAFYLTIYGLIILAMVTSYMAGSGVFVFGALRASRSIHWKLIESVLGTTLRWLDTTPTSRVITRVTQDIRALDGPVSDSFRWFIEISADMLLKFLAVVYITPGFSGPGVAIAMLGGWLGRVYMNAQIAIKREMSNAKAPVLGHFGTSVAGLTSIRAYGAQLAFREESYRRIDRYTKAGRAFYNMNRWINLRVDFLGGLFSAGLAAYLIYVPRERSLPSDVGFSLTMAIGFSSLILWWVRMLNDFEVNISFEAMLIDATYSLERMHTYINAEQEPKRTKQGIPPAYWPASGDIRVEKLSARYSLDGPKVLHDISFHIKSGERVGVVGRTGSGKAHDSVNLDALRSSITIIPQISDEEDGRLTLDSQISSSGGNLSVGQRQILALARAIVRGSKLLILDEDISPNELKGDVTLITVAHRLQTIIDADKVMVLDAGRIVEFDKPSELLKMENGRFRSLVDESGDKDLLYSMASSSGRAQHAEITMTTTTL
ncbi:ABC transporter type 1, transmembrane domain-containing protein [Lactarius quietus]|nr:ABC transporter type 1, transmembrane domain-containing protein [Lactarius quietus]